MKNALVQMVYARQISTEKPDPKTFFRFIATFQQQLSPKEVIINSNLKMKLINQPQSEDVSTFKPKDQVLVFGQVVEENSLFEGQLRKVSVEQALKFQRIMKKIKSKAFMPNNRLNSQTNLRNDNEINSSSQVIGHRNGGFYQHF